MWVPARLFLVFLVALMVGALRSWTTLRVVRGLVRKVTPGGRGVVPAAAPVLSRRVLALRLMGSQGGDDDDDDFLGFTKAFMLRIEAIEYCLRNVGNNVSSEEIAAYAEGIDFLDLTTWLMLRIEAAEYCLRNVGNDDSPRSAASRRKCRVLRPGEDVPGTGRSLPHKVSEKTPYDK